MLTGAGSLGERRDLLFAGLRSKLALVQIGMEAAADEQRGMISGVDEAAVYHGAAMITYRGTNCVAVPRGLKS